MATEVNGATLVRLAEDQAEATRKAAAASLAGGLLAAAGRPYSMEEAMHVFADAYYSLFPDDAAGPYQAWKASHNGKRRYGPENELAP